MQLCGHGKIERIQLAPGNREMLERLSETHRQGDSGRSRPAPDPRQLRQTAEVRRWLAAHPRFHLHFTPTSASWLNLVERFFAEITEQRIRRRVFNSVADLEKAIMDYLEQHNANPKPFVWTASAGAILEKVARAKQALESVH